MPWQRDATPISSEILAIHIALVPRGEAGEVLLLGGDEHWADQAPLGAHPDFRKTRIFDVQSGSVLQTPIASPDSDVFCAGHAFTADGRLLIIGGTFAFSTGHGHALDFWGHRHCWLYHSQARKWVEAAQLQPQPGGDGTSGGGRWYPGAVTLGDGDVLTLFGHVEQSDSRHRNTTPERYNVQANAWRGLPSIANDAYRPGSLDVRFLMYPRTFVMPDGRLFFATPMPTEWQAHINTNSDGPHRSAFYDPNSGQYVGAPISNEPENYRQWSYPCVLLPLLPSENYRPRVLECGASQALRIDLGSATPTWQDDSSGSLGINRLNSCAVLLPTGQVCLVGGVQNAGSDGDEKIQAELYDPRINWTTGIYRSGLGVWETDNDLPENSRNYHSAAILLPNGQVLTCGGDKNQASGDPNVVGVKVIELYNPPYYAVGGRLTISDVPRTTTYGHTFTLTVSDTTRISRVALLRNGSCTHAYDFDQRYVGLKFTQGPGTGQITATAPPNGNVVPPGFYTLWVIDNNDRPCVKAAFIRVAYQSCSAITNRSTFSAEEVKAVGGTGTATFNDAVLIVFDGFIHTELSGSPTFEVHWAEQPNNPVPASDFRLVAAPRLLEVNPGDEDVPQRITYPFHVQFPNPNFFDTFTDLKRVRLTFRLGSFTTIETLDLTHSPNPYMIDVNPTLDNPVWLSTDVRVFSIEAGQNKFTNITQHQNDPIPFIQSCIERLNVPNGNGNSLFEALATDATLDAATQGPSSKPIYNYAIARVRYRAITTTANRVRCFFRMFNAAATGLDFDSNTTYRRTTPIDAGTVPLLGTAANNVVSIPFFGSARVETVQGLPNAKSMRDQTLANYEIRDIVPDSAGAEVVVFFGAWLDINQSKKRFPLTVDPNVIDGPYPEAACRPIQEHIRGRHQCIVAEVFFEGDLTEAGETPGSSDNLSQRNLAVLHSDNPGSEESHTSMHTLEIKSSNLSREDPIPRISFATDHGTNKQMMIFAPDRGKAGFQLDELLFRWHNLPTASTVTLTFSAAITTSMLLSLAQLRLSPFAVDAVDETTLSFRVPGPGRLAYLTVPPTEGDATIPSLLSITIPADAARAGRIYRVTVHQVNGRTRSVIGSAEFQIKVSKRELILEEETRTLSVFKHIVGQIPRDDRWWEIMQRYVHYMGTKVDALGGDAGNVHGNPNGSGRPYDPNGPVDEKECSCCDDGGSDDDSCRDHGTYVGHVCTVHYSGHGRFVGFAVKLCAKPKNGEGEKGDVKFFKSSKRDLEKIVVEAQRGNKSVKVIIGSVARWWWKVVGVKRLVVCGCS